MAIRYDKKINQEINRTIKNFNQKIARLEKDERNLLLPAKISKKELKESVYNRTELIRKLKELQSFSQRGAEETVELSSGTKLSKYELNNLKREAKRVKQQLTRDIKKLETSSPKIFGKKQTTTFAQMGDQQYLNLKARRKALEKNIEKLDEKQLKQFTSLINKTRKNKQYMNNIFKENYLKMLTDLGYYYDYDNEKMKMMEEKLMKLDSNKFLKLFQTDKSVRAILDYYPIVTNTFSGINPDDIKEDVTNLYDALIDNIDEIVQDYA